MDIRPSANRIVEFLNSRGAGFATGHDELADPKTAVRVARQFERSLTAVTPKALTGLRKLRATLLAAQGSKSAVAARQELDRFAASFLFRLSFSDPATTTWIQSAGDPILGAILLDVAAVFDAGQWDRIKTCSNEACSSAFFDETRSKTQRWHSYAVCGNKSNVAAFRSRQT